MRLRFWRRSRKKNPSESSTDPFELHTLLSGSGRGDRALTLNILGTDKGDTVRLYLLDKEDPNLESRTIFTVEEDNVVIHCGSQKPGVPYVTGSSYDNEDLSHTYRHPDLPGRQCIATYRLVKKEPVIRSQAADAVCIPRIPPASSELHSPGTQVKAYNRAGGKVWLQDGDEAVVTACYVFPKGLFEQMLRTESESSAPLEDRMLEHASRD